MYVRNNILYISLVEAEAEIERINLLDTEKEKKEREEYNKWIYDWDNNSTGAIMDH
jgi:hypothetical protein